MISSEYKQLHFEVYEIELPYCSVCTPRDDVQGVWNTPLTCEESSDSTYKLYFTKNSSPIIRQPSQAIAGNSYLNSSIFKCVGSANETTPLLKAGRGLASRSTMSVLMTDFKGDPGPLNVSDSGTFFGKLLARNVLEGKRIRTFYYTKDNTQPEPYIVKTSTHYITSASLSGGMFKLSGKDGLKDIEKNSEKYPPPTDLRLTSPLDLTETSITLPEGVDDIVINDVVKIGKELMRVVSTSSFNNSFSVDLRGSDIIQTGEIISKTEPQEHNAGDTIQICRAWNTSIPIVLANVFQTAGILDFVDLSQWFQETQAWNAGASIKGVFHEPENCIDVLNKILSDYTLDMYLDQNTNKAVLSSVSQWLVPTIDPVEEGNDFTGYKEQTLNNERFSRAFIKVVKPNQTDNDDLTNYERIALFTDLETETTDFYGDIKTEQFEPSQTLQFTDAQVLVSRYVKRYSVPPKKIMFNMEERKISNIELGDVIDIRARDKQLYDGTTEEAFNRAQVIKIQPKFNGIGRTYDVTAMTYIPESPDVEPIIITGSTTTINIYNELDNPNVAVNAVIVLDGGIFGSDTVTSPTITAGALAAGSTVKVFCINGATISSRGGKGGDASVVLDSGGFLGIASAEDGQPGGNIYESNGIETDFYINYPTVDGFTSSAELFASGGGGGGASGWAGKAGGVVAAIANGGGGGSGITNSGFGAGLQSYPIRPFSGDSGIQNNGTSGEFTGPGDGSIDAFQIVGPGSLVNLACQSGDGGDSANSGQAISVFTVDTGIQPTDNYEISLAFGSIGPAGQSFTGGNITVYNLSSDSSKLRDGSSVEGVDYTLVSS